MVANNTDEPSKKHFLVKLKCIQDDHDTSDFTIICSGKEIEVHHLVLSLQSGYFARLFKSDFKENVEGQITLDKEPLAAVEAMIQFFYGFTYSSGSGDHFSNPGLTLRKVHPSTPRVTVEKLQERRVDPRRPNASSGAVIFECQKEGQLSDLVCDECHRAEFTSIREFLEHCREIHENSYADYETIEDFKGIEFPVLPAQKSPVQHHATMWTLGDKYEAPGLMKFAERRFDAAYSTLALYPELDQYGIAELLDVVPFIYENTPPDTIGLRASVSKRLNEMPRINPLTIASEKWQEMILKCPEFGVHVITRLGTE